MPRYSAESKEHLELAHPLIREVAREVIKVVDVTVGETWRTREKHQEYLNHEPPRTKVSYEETKHSATDPNGQPESHAVHVLPYPELWEAPMERWYYVGGIVVGIAHQVLPQGVRWRWGGDWDGDDIFSDQSFDDLAHHELVFP